MCGPKFMIMIMIGSTQRQSEYTKLIKQPTDIGNFETQSPYIVLEENDIEAHQEKAKEQGSGIIIELKSEEYGGKNYSFYDIEGHLWNFGSYSCTHCPLKAKSKQTIGKQRLKQQAVKLFLNRKNLEKDIMVLFLPTRMVIDLMSFICR